MRKLEIIYIFQLLTVTLTNGLLILDIIPKSIDFLRYFHTPPIIVAEVLLGTIIICISYIKRKNIGVIPYILLIVFIWYGIYGVMIVSRSNCQEVKVFSLKRVLINESEIVYWEPSSEGIESIGKWENNKVSLYPEQSLPDKVLECIKIENNYPID